MRTAPAVDLAMRPRKPRRLPAYLIHRLYQLRRADRAALHTVSREGAIPILSPLLDSLDDALTDLTVAKLKAERLRLEEAA